MKIYFRCIASFLLVFFTTFPSTSFSLERDYAYSGACIDSEMDPEEEDEDGNYIYAYNSNELCFDCFDMACYYEIPLIHKREVDFNAIPPTNNYYNECYTCHNHPIYSGYLHFRYKGDYPFLKRQIEYSKKYPLHQAYWPETSYKAEKINDIAVILFEDLIDSTALKKVKSQVNLFKNFITDSWYFKRFYSVSLPRSLSMVST